VNIKHTLEGFDYLRAFITFTGPTNMISNLPLSLRKLEKVAWTCPI